MLLVGSSVSGISCVPGLIEMAGLPVGQTALPASSVLPLILPQESVSGMVGVSIGLHLCHPEAGTPIYEHKMATLGHRSPFGLFSIFPPVVLSDGNNFGSEILPVGLLTHFLHLRSCLSTAREFSVLPLPQIRARSPRWFWRIAHPTGLSSFLQSHTHRATHVHACSWPSRLLS